MPPNINAKNKKKRSLRANLIDYRRKNRESKKPMLPKTASAMITTARETGDPSDASAGAPSMKVGTTSEGGGVKVGRRVLVGWMLNWAASVGSMVEVAGGMGVGGGSTIRNVPPETWTNGE
jgi:hypothetical protein